VLSATANCSRYRTSTALHLCIVYNVLYLMLLQGKSPRKRNMEVQISVYVNYTLSKKFKLLFIGMLSDY